MVAVEDPQTRQVLIVGSVYCDIVHDPDIILTHLKAVIDYANRCHHQVLLGMDTNAWSTLWESEETNRRGRKFEQFSITNNLSIANRGAIHTFVGAIGHTIIDVTFHDPSLVVTDWHVSEEDLLSDHRAIRFNIDFDAKIRIRTRKVRQADWSLFKKSLEDSGQKQIEAPGDRVWNQVTLEEGVDCIYKRIIGSLDVVAPEKAMVIRRKVKGWDQDLQH